MLLSAKFFYCYIVYGDKFLQLFHELNIQLDSSMAAIHKAVFSHFNHTCMWFYYFYYRI